MSYNVTELYNFKNAVYVKFARAVGLIVERQVIFLPSL